MKLFSPSADDIVVRPTESSDLESLASVHELCFSRPWSLDDFLGYFRGDLTHLWTAQRVGGSICGFNILRQFPDDAEILSIGVHPDFRGLGIGERLMRCAINHLLSDGVPTLFLEVSKNNDSALSLYRGLGFSVIDERRGYYSGVDGTDSSVSALVMRLNLV